MIRVSYSGYGFTYSGLKLGEIVGAECVGFGDDGDQVDPGAQALHDLNVERLQRVAGGTDEVQAGVYAEIDLLCTARLLLLKHVGFMLVVQELDDGLPRVTVVDIIAKAGGVNDSEANWRTMLVWEYNSTASCSTHL